MAESSVGYFNVVDYIVLCCTLGISVVIGVYQRFVGGKQRNNKEFLLANRSMNPIPVAMSFAASFVSSPAVLGIPGEVYIHGVDWCWNILSVLVAGVIVCRFFIPVYFRLDIVSAYEYLELRFNRTVRMCGMAAFMTLTILFMGLVMYGPALALNVVTGITLWGSVVVTGLVCTLYTTIGGMKAVLWTDVFQVLLIVAGLLVAVIEGWRRLGSFDLIWQTGIESGRINLDFSVDPTIRHTFWSVFIGGIFFWSHIYAANQTMIQRYLTLNTAKKAKLAVALGIVGVAFIFLLTCAAGLILYAYYDGCDPLTLGYVKKADQVIVYFIMELFGNSPGLPGLFVAGVFSATLSTVSSGLNALAAVTMQDIIKPRFKEIDEIRLTKITKMFAFGYGLTAVFISYVISLFGTGLLTFVFNFFGLIGGPVLGLFCLGMFFPWTNSKGAVSGLLFGIIFTSWIVIGAIFYPNTASPPPRSIDMCLINEVNITTMEMVTTGLEISTSSMQTVVARPLIAKFYSVSYAWYTCIGCCSTIIFGLLISFITGATKPCDLDPMTFISVADAMYCCCPEPIKRFFRCGVPRYSTGVEKGGDKHVEMQVITSISGDQEQTWKNGNI